MYCLEDESVKIRICECVLWSEITGESTYCYDEAKFPIDWRDRRSWYCAKHYDMIVECWKLRMMTDSPDNPRYAGTKDLMEVNGV